jgi:serine/threonine protein kinase
MATTTSLPQGLRLFDATYELEGVLGQGGFGITYLAHHIRLGTKVAIKELYPEHLVRRDLNGNVQAQAEMQSEFESLKLRFNREAKTLQDLKHHSSTRFVAKWEEFGTVFIAMEFIDGETLEARIARGILLDEYNATKVMMSILFSLVEVHDKGLLHRDIKPANIILTPNGGVELIDFGSVTKFSANQRTKITSRLLTPAYAPLEQYGQDVMLTPSTDLYALAATIYEAMTGIAPVPALDRANGKKLEVLKNIAPQITLAFSNLIMKSLELRMEDRFLSAKMLSYELHQQVTQINTQTNLNNQTYLPSTKTTTTADSFYKTFIQKLLILVITVPLALILLPILLPKNNAPEITFSSPFSTIQTSLP